MRWFLGSRLPVERHLFLHNGQLYFEQRIIERFLFKISLNQICQKINLNGQYGFTWSGVMAANVDILIILLHFLFLVASLTYYVE